MRGIAGSGHTLLPGFVGPLASLPRTRSNNLACSDHCLGNTTTTLPRILWPECDVQTRHGSSRTNAQQATSAACKSRGGRQIEYRIVLFVPSHEQWNHMDAASGGL